MVDEISHIWKVLVMWIQNEGTGAQPRLRIAHKSRKCLVVTMRRVMPQAKTLDTKSDQVSYMLQYSL
jgi:hypothetical protein